LYATAEACANTTTKQLEDLNVQERAIAQWEQVATKPELELQEKEELVNLRLDCELKALSIRETNHDTHEAKLEADWKSLEETLAKVLGHEVAADLWENSLNIKVEEPKGREKWLAERQPHELATPPPRKMLEELQVAQAGEAQKVWVILG
jgi:hypothetical protein